MISDLRSMCSAALPLASEPGQINADTIIEVYPAATLRAHGFEIRGYKASGREGVLKRQAILDVLGRGGDFRLSAGTRQSALDTDHVFDSVACVLAGIDFLNANVFRPEEMVAGRAEEGRLLARSEGFIWVRRRVSGSDPAG